MTRSNIVMVPFCAEDLKYVIPREKQQHDYYVAFGDQYKVEVGSFLESRCAKTKHGEPISCTIMSEDKVLGCAGVFENFPGSAEAWAVFSEDIGKYKYTLFREIKKHFADYDFIRLQTTARADFKEAQKFILALGFKREARMRKATIDGKDLILYSIVK